MTRLEELHVLRNLTGALLFTQAIHLPLHMREALRTDLKTIEAELFQHLTPAEQARLQEG